MQQCPKCQSDDIHRSRARGRFEEWRKHVTSKRAYRCHACGWRGWGVDLGPRFDAKDVEIATRAMTPDAPNLKGTALAPDEKAPGIDLETLDEMMSKRK